MEPRSSWATAAMNDVPVGALPRRCYKIETLNPFLSLCQTISEPRDGRSDQQHWMCAAAPCGFCCHMPAYPWTFRSEGFYNIQKLGHVAAAPCSVRVFAGTYLSEPCDRRSQTHSNRFWHQLTLQDAFLCAPRPVLAASRLISAADQSVVSRPIRPTWVRQPLVP